MKFKSKLKNILSATLALSMLIGTMPVMNVFAAQSNEYVDPGDSWLSANNRTNELDVNATITNETQYCHVCNKETSVLMANAKGIWTTVRPVLMRITLRTIGQR